MKNTILITAVCACISSLNTAHAADAISIYGIIDLGITHYSSTRSPSGSEGRLLRMDSGVSQGSRIGFRGTEDLGGGNSAFFTLETGYNPDDGSLGQGGAIFGRQAFVGLRNQHLGSLSVGRQYDFMTNLGGSYAMGANSAAGALAWGLHADAANGTALNNHIFGGDRTNNSIKYQSNDIGGLSAGVMYGFGEVSGNSSAGRTTSGLLNYTNGKFGAGAAFVNIRNAADTASTRAFGIGASYSIDQVKFWGVGTQVKNTLSTAVAKTYEAGATYSLTPSIDFSAAYQYQDRNLGVGSARALVAIIDYKLSKRTDIYLGAVHDKDDGYNAFPVFGGGVQSFDDSQTAVRVGMRHRF